MHALHAAVKLLLEEGACLPLRSRFGGCRACASACPAGVLDVTVDRVALADGCLQCGRCTAACPTSALHLDGFAVGGNPPTGNEPLEIECAKVAAAHRSADAIEVPCLGGLSAGRIAAWHEAAGDRGIELIDRGWCGRCSAGGCAQRPAQPALQEVVLWLDAVADPRPRPRFTERPLPAESMPAAIPLRPEPDDPGPALSRRSFFRTLATDPIGRGRKSTPIGGAGRAAFPASARRESPEKRRLRDALDAAAARAGSTLPNEFFARVTGNGTCLDDRICVGACPTGALNVVETEGAAALTFAATACIGCGACARACPEHALEVAAHGGERAPVVIATHVLRACSTCGEHFAAPEAETECLACRKSRRFIGDAMAQLFGAGR